DAIDLTGKKLKISHKAVPALRWPDMTMMFSVESSALLDHVKVGDKISFDFYPQGSSFVISDLKVQ
ncbi:MAG: copper-binding protein, partial [Deltaproteobacteria bacterium]|nr:copper-binding protein [Deltaproteobacteria bacterium]